MHPTILSCLLWSCTTLQARAGTEAEGQASRATELTLQCGLPQAVQGKREKALLAGTDLDILGVCQEMLRQ